MHHPALSVYKDGGIKAAKLERRAEHITCTLEILCCILWGAALKNLYVFSAIETKLAVYYDCYRTHQNYML